MMELKPYPEYKDSGVPWIGAVPNTWLVKPGLFAYSEKKTKNIGLQETTVLSLSYGRIVIKPPEKLHGLVPASFETYQIVNPGDIIIRSTDLQNDWNSLRVGLVENRGIITSAYICLKTKNVMIPDYCHLLLHAYDLTKVFYGMGSGLRQNLDWKDFKRIPILIPSIEEQERVVSFLRAITKQFSRFIRAKQRLIKLLKEQKQVIINQAVTKGIDPNVKLKPSGVDWLGDIPEHWEARRVRTCIQDVKAGCWGDDPDSKNYGDHIVCVRVADFDMVNFSVSQSKLTVRAMPQSIREPRLLKCEDILLEKSGGGDAQPVGRVVGFSLEQPAVSSNFISRIRPDISIVSPRFLLFLLVNLQAIRQNIPSIKQTTGIQNLDEKNYLSNIFGLPPMNEQTVIVNYLDNKMFALNEAISSAEGEIGLIQEYRIRLISDVVTGKVDVRDVPVEPIADTEMEEPLPAEDTEAFEEVVDG